MSFNDNGRRYPELISDMNSANYTKRISLHQQENEVNIHRQQSNTRLGLTLARTPSLVKEVQQLRFAQERQRNGSKSDENKKPKASKFPITSIQIGQWQKISTSADHLNAKIYFTKKRLIWEILDYGPGNTLKKKIEFLWSNILAIRATILDNESTVLTIALDQVPSFKGEIKPQPGRHTLWEDTFDFTEGQASTWRIHVLQFPPGSLDKNYESLLQSDQRLFELSQKPFPNQMWPYFQLSPYNSSQLSFNTNIEPSYPHELQSNYDAALLLERELNPITPSSDSSNENGLVPFNTGLGTDTIMDQPINYNQNYPMNYVEQTQMLSHPDTSVLNPQMQLEYSTDLNDELTKLWDFLNEPIQDEDFPPDNFQF